MSKENENEIDDIRPEYDFSQLKGKVRGKYADQYRAGTNLIRLDADVALVFQNEKAVNDALRMLIDLAQKQVQSSIPGH